MRKVLKMIFRILLILLLLLIAGILITYGLHYSKISNKHYAFGLVVDQAFDKAERIFSVSPDYLVGDNFTVEGTLKMELSSEDYQNKSLTDPEYVKKNLMLRNLSLMNTTYRIQHDKKNSASLVTLDEKIGEEEIFSGSYLIQNSTQYYFVKGVVGNYVNNGGNNYFESYTDEITTTENLNYLYDFIRDSIKKNILEEDLDSDIEETLINGQSEELGRISYRITDKSYKTLLKAILKDIKNDSRAHQIVSLMVPNIDELKVDEKKQYLKKNESYTIHVYVSRWLYEPVKCEVVHVLGDEKEVYSYEGNMDKGLFYYSKNNEAKYHATYESSPKKIDIIVYNRFDKEVGTIKGEKDKNNMMLTMTLELETKKYDVSYSVKNKDLSGKKYTRENTLTFKLMDQKVTMLQGNVELVSTIDGNAKVEEDTSSSVLESTLSEQEKTGMDTLRDRIKERLER